jgi:hypothetical protein
MKLGIPGVGTVEASPLSQTLLTMIEDGDGEQTPPAEAQVPTYPNAPLLKNETSVPIVPDGPNDIDFSASKAEKMYRVLPATIYAFRLSGEKSAAVAPVILSATLLWLVPLLVKMNTWLGVASVSDTITVLPSGETANTFPVTEVNSLTVAELAVGLSTINPLVPRSPRSVPR